MGKRLENKSVLLSKHDIATLRNLQICEEYLTVKGHFPESRKEVFHGFLPGNWLQILLRDYTKGKLSPVVKKAVEKSSLSCLLSLN